MTRFAVAAGSVVVLMSSAVWGDEVAADDGAVDVRDADAAVGIGAGWTFPEEILRPNTVSARLRFGKFAIEPGVSLGG
ncbi:MAG: hypothetical protein ACOZIN_10405, partial [Myxococcota bacterium]